MRRKKLFAGVMLALCVSMAGCGSKISAEDLVSEAEELWDDEEYEDAAAKYEEALKVNEEDDDIYLSLAKCYEEMENMDAAAEILRKGYDKTGSNKLRKYMRGKDIENAQEIGRALAVDVINGTIDEDVTSPIKMKSSNKPGNIGELPVIYGADTSFYYTVNTYNGEVHVYIGEYELYPGADVDDYLKEKKLKIEEPKGDKASKPTEGQVTVADTPEPTMEPTMEPSTEPVQTPKPVQTPEPVQDNSEDKTIRVMSFTDEVPHIIDYYMETHPELDYKIEYTIISTAYGEYQPALDDMLLYGGENAPDIYAADSAFVLKYCQGDASRYAATYKDLGIDVDRLINESQIAGYAYEIGTRPYDGEIVGLPYEGTGGCFIYRRSIAREVFGTDDPEVISNMIGGGSGNWDQFMVAAEALNRKGYSTLSGIDDLWPSVENSADLGWVVNGKLYIDTKREAFLDLALELYQNGYTNDNIAWNKYWFSDMADGGKRPVFAYMGPAWMINYTLAPNCGTTDGDWAVCEAPVSFFWGGTWVLANKNVAPSKQQVVADILQWITLDSSPQGFQYAWATGSYNYNKDSVSSNRVMSYADGSMDFLDGQNMFEYMIPANEKARGDNMTVYDETINYIWKDRVRSYAHGETTRSEAIDLFREQVWYSLGIQ